jgi:hypothetical protein
LLTVLEVSVQVHRWAWGGGSTWWWGAHGRGNLLAIWPGSKKKKKKKLGFHNHWAMAPKT